MPEKKEASASAKPARFTRRRFLGTVFGACAALGGYTALVEPYWAEWSSHLMRVRGLPRDLEGATLVHLSDLHAGPEVADAFLIGIFQRVARLAPDFVIGTGDWLSREGEWHLKTLERVLKHFPQGKRGTFGVLGNHDWGRAWRNRGFARQVAAIARTAGVEILENTVTSVGGLHFAGLDDFWSPNFDPKPLLAAGPFPEATIALAHNPDVVDLGFWSKVGFRGWTLSGHTHGGQCKPPFLPPPLLPVRNRRYTSGEFDLFDGRTLYISRGVGNLRHIRFNARPEIAVFTLCRAA